ncbi:hypothetical protein ACHAQJ_002939 [Trichoderma viride]
MTSYYTLAECGTSVQLRNGGGGGLVLLQDTQLIETLAHFNRERIPERVVHAQAAGYLNLFIMTPGKKTDLLTRISTVGPERGSAETVRDVHGWAIKLYTDEGNQDFVFNNIPVFFVRDPIKFPSVNRSHKRNPRTNLPDANMFWDFHTGNPETIHATMQLFTDRGMPVTLRGINGYSGHTYEFTKEDGSFKYVKMHLKTRLGIQSLDRQTATKLAGENPNHLTADLFNAIEKGDYPTWDVFVQVMDLADAESYKWNIFDMTKVWPHNDYSLRKIGQFMYNRNPNNYFTDIEQAALSPSNMVPGITPSADPMCFKPACLLTPTLLAIASRDGLMNFGTNYGDDPNYVNSSLHPITYKNGGKATGLTTITEHEKWVGQVTSFSSEVGPEDYEQSTLFWQVLGREPGQQERFIGNVADHFVRGERLTAQRKGLR